MNLELTYELDPSLLLEGMKSIYSRRFLLIRLYSTLMGISGMALLLVVPTYSGLGWVFLVGGPLTWITVEIQWRRMAVKQLKPFKGPIKAKLDNDLIQQELSIGKSEIKWSAVSQARRTDRLWLLSLSPVQAIHLPRSAFGAEAESEFKTFLQQRQLLD